jgi:cardiolipin synthase
MEKQVNIPNMLSGLRLLTAPAIFLLIIYSTPRNYPYLIAVFCFSMLLDLLDGYLARKLCQETELGKILDPVADKVMVFLIIPALIIKSDFPLWLGIIILSRDFLILLASWILIKVKKIKRVTPSILIGKVAFSAVGALILIYMLDLHKSLELDMVKRYFIVLCVGFLGWSVVEYFEVYKKQKNAD